MSLIRPVLRLTTCAALSERTWAEGRVYDSDNTPLEQTLRVNDAPKPYIVIYTDNDDRTESNGTDVYQMQRTVNLVIEISVASKVQGEGVDSIEVVTPHTDSGMELSIDIVESQVMAALVGDIASEWGELFKLIVCKVARVGSRRGGRAEVGVRWAARQLIFNCETIYDVPPGQALDFNHPIRKFLTMAKLRDEDTGFPAAASIIENMIDMDTQAPSWERAQSWLGLTRRGIRSDGVAPLASDAVFIQATETPASVVDDDREGPLLTRNTITDADSNVTASENVP